MSSEEEYYRKWYNTLMESVAEMKTIYTNKKMPSGIRYEAAVVGEDSQTLADQFLALAELAKLNAEKKEGEE